MRVHRRAQARVLQQMSPDNVGDNTLLEKALLTTLRDEPHIIRLIECWHDRQVRTRCTRAPPPVGSSMLMSRFVSLAVRQNLYTVMEYGDSELTNYIASLPAAMMSEAEARHYFRHFLLGKLPHIAFRFLCNCHSVGPSHPPCRFAIHPPAGLLLS